MSAALSYPQDCYVNLRGLRFYYRDWGGGNSDGDGPNGPGGGRPPVLLLHGLASTGHIWDLVAPRLAAGGLRVAAPDQRGHGRSAQVDAGYDFASVAGDAAALLAGLGWRRPLIVGHSWGADVALELAAAQPELASGLVFVDGGTIEPSARPGWTPEQARQDMAPPVFTGFTPAMMRERVIASGRFGPEPPAAVIDAVLANFRILDDGTIQARLRRENHLRIIDALWEHKPSQLYPAVSCPVLLLPARQAGAAASALDRRLRREESIARAEALLPRRKTVWLEDSIHDVPLQRPALVADTIRQHIDAGFFA